MNSLEGETKEQYAVDLYKHLGIGPKKTDEGVLLLVAPKDRQYKIEVGYGLEPVINDARAGDIGRSMVPSLRAGDYSAAILEAMTQIAQLVAADKGVQLTGVPNRPRAPATSQKIPWWLVFLGIYILFAIIRAIVRRGGGGPRWGYAAAAWVCLLSCSCHRWAAEAGAVASAAVAVEALAASAAA